MTDAIPIILTGTYKNGPEGRDRTSKGRATGFTDQPASTYGLPLVLINGLSSRTRTCDLCFPKAAFYQTELYSVFKPKKKGKRMKETFFVLSLPSPFLGSFFRTLHLQINSSLKERTLT